MPVQEWDFLDKGFSAFLQAKKIRQQEEQFNQEMGMRERQQSFMEYIQRKTVERQLMEEQRLGQSERFEQDMKVLKLGSEMQEVTPQVPFRPPGGSVSGMSLLDMSGNSSIAQEQFKVGSYYAPKQEPVEYDTQVIEEGGKKFTIEYPKGGKVSEGRVISEAPRWEPDKPEKPDKERAKQITSDLANLKGIIADVEGLRTATKETVEGQQIIYPAGAEKGMTASDYEIKYIQPQKNKGKIYAEKLIRTNKLQSAVTILKEYLSKGYDLNTSLKMFKEDNPEITADDEEILAGYLYLEGL